MAPSERRTESSFSSANLSADSTELLLYSCLQALISQRRQAPIIRPSARRRGYILCHRVKTTESIYNQADSASACLQAACGDNLWRRRRLLLDALGLHHRHCAPVPLAAPTETRAVMPRGMGVAIASSCRTPELHSDCLSLNVSISHSEPDEGTHTEAATCRPRPRR